MRIASPFPEYAWPMVWNWIQPFRNRVFDDFAPRDLAEFVDKQVARAQGQQVRTWGVWRDEELGGLLWFEHVLPGVAINHVLFKRSFWGRGTTVPALVAAYREMFDGGVRKIIGSVFEDNHAIRSLFRSIGGQEHMLLREVTTRGGKPADMVLVGITREDLDGALGPGRALRQPQNPTGQHDRSDTNAGSSGGVRGPAEADPAAAQ